MDIKKIIAKLPTGYIDEAAGLNGDGLRTEIIKAETAIREVETALKADEKLTGAREIVKDMVGGYNDAKRAQRAKIAYSLHMLDERGELGTGEWNTSDAVTREGRPGPVKNLPEPKAKARVA